MKYSFVFIAAVILSLAFTSTIFAHAHPEGFDPEDGETVEGEVETITAFFDSGIESATTATVTDEEGNEYELADETIEGNDYIATLQEPLTTGNYTVELTVLAEDGHTTEESFTFSVDADEVVEEEESTEEISEEESAVESTEDGDDGGSGALIIGAIAVIIVGGIIFFVLRGRKAA